MYMCVYTYTACSVCMYMCVYTYIYIYIHTPKERLQNDGLSQAVMAESIPLKPQTPNFCPPAIIIISSSSSTTTTSISIVIL